MTRGKRSSLPLDPCCLLPHVDPATLIVKLNLLPRSVWYGLVAAGVQFWKSRSGEIELGVLVKLVAWFVIGMVLEVGSAIRTSPIREETNGS